MAWMRTLNDNESQQNGANVVAEKKPPSNLLEFLMAEELDDWPLPMSFENPLDIQSDGILMSTQEDIIAILNEAAPLGLDKFDKLEKRLSDLEVQLNVYGNKLFTDGKSWHGFVDQQSHLQTIFVTELPVHDNPELSTYPHGYKYDFADILLQTKKRGLDLLKFPGFKHGEFIELPAKLEAPPILHQVSKVQSFKPAFRKFWKMIFMSEASSAVLQDSFWWIFLDHFNKEESCETDKDLLFNRIADSYTALFTSINQDVRDKFLSFYPDCLSQALYCTFREAFPESPSRFNEDFKHYLVNLVYEWITGLHPLPGLWKKWNEEGLKLPQRSKDHETTKKLLEAAAVNEKVEFSLDVDACTKVIEKLGTTDCDLSQGFISRSNTKSPREKFCSVKTESHQLGPGAEFERVKFNISGRSPLIAQYLHMKQLRTDKQAGAKVRRTEITKLPPDGTTYQEFIASTLEKSANLSKEYAKACEKTSDEILDIKRQQRATNKEINKLRRALIAAANAQERSLAIEAVAQYKERTQKEIALLEHQSPESDSNESTSCDEESLNLN
ncbi:hypothetical protein BsWGS_04430 [Bradybaena similaris]